MTDQIPLCQRLAQARADRVVIDTPSVAPADANASYTIQHELLDALGATIGGWKVGAKSPGGTAQCAPLPAADVRPSGARLSRCHFLPLGLELEIAFKFDRAFEPRADPYLDEEVLGAIGAMAAAIEVVSSRYAAWPNVEKLLQLADLQNHGALVVGEFRAYDADYSFSEPELDFSFEQALVTNEAAINPAGDPRTLLPWLVNHVTQRGITLTPSMVVTTGSYSGMFFPKSAGAATGTISGFLPVHLELF
jgi:2-keto-4-pentenoate hydratase